MALNYANFQTLAERLINENGRSMTLTRKDQGNPVDAAKPWRESTDAAEISFAVVGVVIEYEKEEVDGELIRRGDKRILIAAKDIEDEGPANEKVEDYSSITDGTTVWRIVDVQVIEPGDTRILYDLQARQ